MPALLPVVRYYAGAISDLERLYLKPSPGTGMTDARLVVEPASAVYPATGRAASQRAPAVLATLRLGRTGEQDATSPLFLADARLRQILCMGASDHTLVPTPGANACQGQFPGAVSMGLVTLTPDLAVRGRFPHALGTWSQVERLAPESTDSPARRTAARCELYLPSKMLGPCLGYFTTGGGTWHPGLTPKWNAVIPLWGRAPAEITYGSSPFTPLDPTPQDAEPIFARKMQG